MKGTKGMQVVRIPSSEVGSRVDRFLRRVFPSLPNSLFQRLARKGSLMVSRDGKLSRGDCKDRLVLDDAIFIPEQYAREDTSARLTEESRKPQKPWWFSDDMILFKDDNFIILNKPCRVASQPGTDVEEDLSSSLRYLQGNRSEIPRLVYRLDRGATGVIVIARDLPATRYITELSRKQDRMKKVYWAIVVGKPERLEGRVRTYIRGKAALTEYRSIRSITEGISWLELTLITGAKRQLRKHCAEVLKCPILGDHLYPSELGDNIRSTLPSKLRPGPNQFHLHSRHIEFDAPDGSVISVDAPPPNIFIDTLRAMQIDAYTEDPLETRLQVREKRKKKQIRDFNRKKTRDG